MLFDSIKTLIKDKIIDSALRSKDKNISLALGKKTSDSMRSGGGTDVLIDGMTESVKTIAAFDTGGSAPSYGYLGYYQETATSTTVDLPTTFDTSYQPVVVVYNSTGAFKTAGVTVTTVSSKWQVGGLVATDIVSAIGLII
jgi:hypothetical protein